jgi:hypothetical protein
LVTVIATDAQTDVATSVMRSNGALDVDAERRRGRWGSLAADETIVGREERQT